MAPGSSERTVRRGDARWLRVLLHVGLLAAVCTQAVVPDVSAIPDNSWQPMGETPWVKSRFSVSNRTLMMDGKAVLLRGVTYSPTPIGKDQSAEDPSKRVVDFFADSNRAVWERDLPLMRQMGMNSLRTYDFSVDNDHTAFLDHAQAHNLSVLAGFPLHHITMDLRDNGPASATPNPMDLNLAVRRLRAKTAAGAAAIALAAATASSSTSSSVAAAAAAPSAVAAAIGCRAGELP